LTFVLPGVLAQFTVLAQLTIVALDKVRCLSYTLRALSAHIVLKIHPGIGTILGSHSLQIFRNHTLRFSLLAL